MRKDGVVSTYAELLGNWVLADGHSRWDIDGACGG